MYRLPRCFATLVAAWLSIVLATPTLAQVEGIKADSGTAQTCATVYLVYGGRAESYSQMLGKSVELSGRSREELDADADRGATNLRNALFRRTITRTDGLDIFGRICPAVFGIAAPPMIYDPAPPIAQADLPAYQYGIGKVWNCQAQIPETLDKGAEVHTYRLRFSVGLDKDLRLSGYVDAYQEGQDNPFARYPLTGWPYRSDWAPGVVAELGQPSSGNALPDYINWIGFWMDIGFKPIADSNKYYLTGQIDRRSDTATRVRLETCYDE